MRSRSLVLIASSLVAVTAFTACGDSSNSSAATSTSSGASTTVVGESTTTISLPVPPVPPKPTVKIPATLPTALVVTELRPGTGEPSKAGDKVVVHYVGVRSVDGTEFDSSYDRGSPFAVENVGQASVIDGWNEGLIGVKTGEQLQLDIPADKAYGDNPNPGGVIQAGDALTFVIDVVVVIPAVDPADEPDVTVKPSSTLLSDVVTTDLVPGDGAEVGLGNTVAIHIIAFRADTGAKLTDASTWPGGGPVEYLVGSPDGLIGLNEGLVGMKVGGRRQISIPFADGWGEGGREELGLPASTDIVLVIDLFASY